MIQHPTSKEEALQQRDAFKLAAQREHELMRSWMRRALTAEARLKMYDHREKQA